MTNPPTEPRSGARKGTLYLVPAPLDFGCDTQVPLQNALPSATLQTAARLTQWVCENAKSTRAYLKRIDALHPLAASLQQQQITELPREVHKKGDHGDKGSAPFDARPLLAAALNGHDMGLISEAGMPAVADPGSSVVRAAHDLDIPVVPLVGPVSLLLALAASGLNGQNFAFVGYLPQDSQEPQNPLLHPLLHHTRHEVDSGKSPPDARIRSQLVRQWRQQPTPPDNRTPVVFAMGR